MPFFSFRKSPFKPKAGLNGPPATGYPGFTAREIPHYA
jgi:hypothetical protein